MTSLLTSPLPGIGLQLTNILRDVGEDLERGRIYLPLDEIHAFGLTEDDLFRYSKLFLKKKMTKNIVKRFCIPYVF